MVWRAEQGDAYALLSALLLEQKGVEPLPEIVREAWGKPRFRDLDVEFSLSHSGGWALCALAEGPVGCDIETVKPRRPGLPAYVLDARELEWFRAQGERWEDLYTLWTLKEARVKCTGEGLRYPPRTISVPLLTPGERAVWEGFTFSALSGEGWRGAVCELL